MKGLGLILIVLAFLVGGLWVSHGADLATREKEAVKVKTVDDFGDEVESIVWKVPTNFPITGFHVGLDLAGPAGGGLFLVGGILFMVGRRRSRSEA